jgi:hypothetical protein
MELRELVDLYEVRKSEREQKLREFFDGTRKYIIVQRPAYTLWGVCNSVEQVYRNNMHHLESWLRMDWSDELPHLQPWVGTGVYANAFGCEYLWREDDAPDTHYRFHKIEEVKGLDYPDYRDSPVMRMILEIIDVLKERTEGHFPIACTDTQSPFDTATLILDAVEFFVACYTAPEIVDEFMETITRMVIEFSRAQAEHIGEQRVSRPGHVMPSLPGFRGICISDDNLAVSSPEINERVSLRFNQKIADALDGVAIHSCGVWDHTIRRLKDYDVVGIDCAIDGFWDPTPNDPVGVKNAVDGGDFMVKARCGEDIEQVLVMLEKFVDPRMRLILDIPRSEDNDEAYAKIAELNYKRASEKLAELYSE